MIRSICWFITFLTQTRQLYLHTMFQSNKWLRKEWGQYMKLILKLPNWLTNWTSACNTDTTPTQPHRISNTHRTKNNTTNVVNQQNSRKLLMMDILMSETCWAHKKWNKIASDIKLVFYSSTITMMHGPTNIKLSLVLRTNNDYISKYYYKMVTVTLIRYVSLGAENECRNVI